MLDIIRKTTHLLIDLGLSKTGNVGLLLASQMIPMTGFIMSSGNMLPLSLAMKKPGSPLVDVMRRVEKRAQEKPGPLTQDQEDRLARAVVSAVLASGISANINYQNVGESAGGTRAPRDRDSRPAPVRVGARVGRNEPCPCGSGRKNKQCCGRR